MLLFGSEVCLARQERRTSGPETLTKQGKSLIMKRDEYVEKLKKQLA